MSSSSSSRSSSILVSGPIPVCTDGGLGAEPKLEEDVLNPGNELSPPPVYPGLALPLAPKCPKADADEPEALLDVDNKNSALCDSSRLLKKLAQN